MMNKRISGSRIMCAAAAAVLALSMAGCGKHEIQLNTRPVTSPYPEAVDADTELESLADSESEESAAETTAETEQTKKKKKKTTTTEAETTEETTTTTEPEPEIPDVRREQPYLGAADGDDFSDACFIGASQTVGLSLFGGKVAPDFYAYAGLNVKMVFTKRFLTEDGRTAAVSDSDGVDEDGLYTVMDMMDKKSYGRIYILFGINEMGGWIDYSQFYDGYTDLIRQIKAAQPGAVIYVESVLPVSKYALNTNQPELCETYRKRHRERLCKYQSDVQVRERYARKGRFLRRDTYVRGILQGMDGYVSVLRAPRRACAPHAGGLQPPATDPVNSVGACTAGRAAA